MLVVVAIGAVVTVGGFVMFSQYRRDQNVKLAVSEISSAMRETQRRSITQQDGKHWGMRLSGSDDSFQTWSGLSYASGTVDQTYALRRGVRFGNPPSGFTVDLPFQAISGILGDDKVISINSGARSLVGDVIINILGKATTRLEKGLVGYWHFDEGTSTVAYDASGNGNAGTLANGPTWQSGTNCKAGGCLNFNGTSNYVSFPTLSFEGEFTVSVWVRFDTLLTNWHGIISGSGSRVLMRQSSHLYMELAGSTNIGASNLGEFQNSKWYNFVLIRDAENGVKLYRNGSLVHSTSAAGTVNFSRVGSQGSYYLHGEMDEVRVYNRALSEQEVLDVYNDLK